MEKNQEEKSINIKDKKLGRKISKKIKDKEIMIEILKKIKDEK